MRISAPLLLSTILVGTVAGGPLATEATLPAPGTLVAPVNRSESYFAAGEAFLANLPDGTKISVQKVSGAKIELRLEDRRLSGKLPGCEISEDRRVVTSPLGYRLSSVESPYLAPLRVEAPTGRWSRFHFLGKHLHGRESDGGKWVHKRENFGLRLPDGTRVDGIDLGASWELISLGGERLRLDARTREWSVLPSIPSPPLIPDPTLVYMSGDGDDWRYPAREDHMVFAWNWYPYGLPLERAIEDVREGFRRDDINFYFVGLDRMPPAEEAGAYLLGRRLSLSGGDQLTFEAPGRKAVTIYIMPGPIDPDFLVPKLSDAASPGRPDTNRESPVTLGRERPA